MPKVTLLDPSQSAQLDDKIIFVQLLLAIQPNNLQTSFFLICKHVTPALDHWVRCLAVDVKGGVRLTSLPPFGLGLVHLAQVVRTRHCLESHPR